LPIRLVVGLGNPGPRYQDTRHNAGFRVLDRLAAGGRWKAWRALGETAEIALGGASVRLAKPLTSMNLSGRMVRSFSLFHKVPPGDILICYDEFQLPIPAIRMRLGGSSGGHNGMQSVIDELGTPDVPRLRIGVGPLPQGEDPADFVLRRMSAAEAKELAPALDRAAEAVRIAVAGGMEKAMNAFNAAVPEAGA